MARWELYEHEADMGVRGFGTSKEQAFEQAALAMTAAVTDPAGVEARERLAIACEAPDEELLLAEWLNTLIYEMSTRKMLYAMLAGGARWAVERGWGTEADLERIEEHGQMRGAKPKNVSQRAKKRQQDEMGTLGSGNHYLEVQEVTAVYDAASADAFDIGQGDVVVMIIRRKGATRAFGPRHPDLPERLRDAGQPVLIGGSMGTGSYVLAGTKEAEALSFSSACHGAGRAISRKQATRQWKGREVVDELAGRGIVIKSPSMRGVAEEAPEAYKDVSEVVESADAARTRKVARLEPLICLKG